MAYSAFGINYDTAVKITAYGGDAETPAQPIWAEDTHQLWIVHGTQGKYRIAMADELSAYLTTANAASTYLSREDASKTYATPEHCTQLINEINEFRRKSTTCQVGDKVGCAFQYERFLECTKAGTTSADLLDTRNVTHGQVIADGTAEWTVRTRALSVNGAVADATGNVVISDGLNDVLAAANMAINNNLVNTGQVDLATVLNTVNALNAEYQRIKEMLNGAKFIIETGKSDNGNAWYRKWSDGWIEQGGYQPNTGNGNHYFDFLIPFKDMNYTVVATGEQPKTNAEANATVAKETTTRVYITTQSYAYKTYLYACGY